uniref:Heat stress transcription factor B-4 n=1 Tax=Cajanus cajan TaxID=3821 RepID=A0A151RI74_CAJCA|nr:Heat stress transcription factor B-4 [Cajanus cajan]
MALLLDNCEGILLSLDSHKSVPAPFLTKTYQLVDDPTTDHIVSWGEDDTTFVVWRPPEFARDLLPNYFKHNNFSSFVRQLNTYGFRKIVPDRWEFANEFFKKGEKHLLCEIHRRKTAQPQQGSMNQHSHLGDNERLRRSNNMLLSELAHMKKLYNDIIYFVQNHVKPVAPSNSYSSSLLLSNTPSATPISSANVLMMQRPMNQLLGYYSSNPKQGTAQPQPQNYVVNSPTNTSRSSITIVEGHSSNGNNCKTKLFGVSLQSKKRVHPDYGSNSETNKARLVLEKDDLGLNLMPPSTC